MFKNFIEQTINGLQTGSIYALIALGYTMVYGIVKLINFAHGDILMVGAYAVLVAISNGMPSHTINYFLFDFRCCDRLLCIQTYKKCSQNISFDNCHRSQLSS